MTPLLLLSVAAAAGVAPPVVPRPGGLLFAYRVQGTDTFTVSPDGRRAACCNGWNMKLVDLRTGKVTGKFTGSPKSVRIPLIRNARFCPDGFLVVIATDTIGVRGAEVTVVHLVDLDKDRVLWSRQVHKGAYGRHAIDLSRDGRWLATGGDFEDCSARIWDLTNGRRLKSFEFRDSGLNFVEEVSFNPSGTLLSVGLDKGQVKVIDTKTWEVVREKKVNSFLFRAFFLDDRRLAVVWQNLQQGRNTVVWDAGPKSKAKDRKMETGTKFVRSPKGSFLVIGLTTGGLRLCDWATGKESREFRAHKGPIADLHFSRDGSRLYTAGPEGIKVWSVPALLRALPRDRD